MGYDDVITHLGKFGRYQRRVYILICLPAISCAFHKFAGVFILATPDHRCLLPYENETTAEYDIPEHTLQMSYPVDHRKSKWSSCQYLDANYTEDYFNSSIPAEDAVYCSKWIYDHSRYQSSAAMDWNLVCSRSWLKASSDSLFMFGVLIGSIIFGQLSDKYGRKPIFFTALVLQLVFGILAGVAPEYITYTISRVVIGAATVGVFLVAYVIAMEMVGPKHRLFAGVVCCMFFSVGFMLTTVFVYFITEWRWLQIILTLPGVLFMSYYWFIPESARWLLANHRKEAAINIIQKAAKENKVKLPDDILDNLLDDSSAQKNSSTSSSPSVFDLLRFPNLRRKSLLIFYDWFVNSGTYYGLSWNVGNLGGNDLLNFFILGAVEIPAYTFLLLTLNRWGRRVILCGCMLFAGTMLLLTTLVPANLTWLTVLLAMLGKLAITASYGTIYVFSAEQFPTVIRNVGLGAASMCARVGGIIAPYINHLGIFWLPLPLLIFGIMAFIGGLLSLLLPETHNKPLLETIEDGERFGRKVPKSSENNKHNNIEKEEMTPVC